MKHSTNHFLTHSPRLSQEKAAHFGTGTSDFSSTSHVNKSYKLVAVGACQFIDTCKCRCFATNTYKYGGQLMKGISLPIIGNTFSIQTSEFVSGIYTLKAGHHTTKLILISK